MLQERKGARTVGIFERANIFVKAAEAGIRWVRYYRCQYDREHDRQYDCCQRRTRFAARSDGTGFEVKTHGHLSFRCAVRDGC